MKLTKRVTLIASVGLPFFLCLFFIFIGHRLNGGRDSSAVECATPGEEVPGSIPVVAARSLQVGSVSVKCDRLRQKSWSPSSVSCVAARKIVRRSCLGARLRYNLVVDEDVKKPNKQNKT